MLVFDVWHPDLTDREVQFLSSLQRSRMRAEMAHEKAFPPRLERWAFPAATRTLVPSPAFE